MNCNLSKNQFNNLISKLNEIYFHKSQHDQRMAIVRSQVESPQYMVYGSLELDNLEPKSCNETIDQFFGTYCHGMESQFMFYRKQRSNSLNGKMVHSGPTNFVDLMITKRMKTIKQDCCFPVQRCNLELARQKIEDWCKPYMNGSRYVLNL